MHIYIHTYTYTCINKDISYDSISSPSISLYVCMHICMYECLYVCMYLCMYIYKYTYMYIYMYVYVYIYVYVYTYIYIYIYIHVYMCLRGFIGGGTLQFNLFYILSLYITPTITYILLNIQQTNINIHIYEYIYQQGHYNSISSPSSPSISPLLSAPSSIISTLRSHLPLFHRYYQPRLLLYLHYYLYPHPH
jgi:hypothetical protein